MGMPGPMQNGQGMGPGNPGMGQIMGGGPNASNNSNMPMMASNMPPMMNAGGMPMMHQQSMPPGSTGGFKIALTFVINGESCSNFLIDLKWLIILLL